MPTLLLARHAQGSFGGADYDVLSARGREQAEALAADLLRRRVRIDRIASGLDGALLSWIAGEPGEESFGRPFASASRQHSETSSRTSSDPTRRS